MKTYEEEEHKLSVERGVTSIVTMEEPELEASQLPQLDEKTIEILKESKRFIEITAITKKKIKINKLKNCHF